MPANFRLDLVTSTFHQEGGKTMLSLTDSWEAQTSLPPSWPWQAFLSMYINLQGTQNT